jgi:cyclohexadieny/prephenate dehydrogenase
VPEGLGAPLSEPLFQRLVLIGMGLIGSSLARVCRRKGLAREIIAADSSAAVCRRVAELGVADKIFEEAGEAVRGADLVILCTPVGAMGAVAQEIAPHVEPGAIISDVGSVKSAIIKAVAPHLPSTVHFVPAHPVAGTEQSGPDAGFSALFLNRWCILTPPERTDLKAVAKLAQFWTGAGASVECMQAAHHDLVLAITSHVPHLIAYNIVGTAAHLEEVTQSEVIKFSAGGFRDFTRIAASDPTMWRDIFLNNREAVLEMLGRFSEDLSALQRMIRYGDGDGLYNLFTRTRAIRRGIIEQGQETAAPDFGRRAGETET